MEAFEYLLLFEVKVWRSRVAWCR